MIQEYFSKSYYWKIDGKPYFSFYDLNKLVEGFGSVEKTRKGLDLFREKAKKAGLPGLHLNAVFWNQVLLPETKEIADPGKLIADLGFDSCASYCWAHHGGMDVFPLSSYETQKEVYFDHWKKTETAFKPPYIPNVSIGWDCSARSDQTKPWVQGSYPFTPVIQGTPALFQESVQETIRRLKQPGNHLPTFNINSWNEWTEGSYLEPDKLHKWGYLKALKAALAAEKQ